MNRLPTVQEIKNFRKVLNRWVNKNKRDYPWRKTDDPFKVLIAEMMLQRTKADQVQPVYLKFFSNFKTPAKVARANIRRLNHILYPLGLRWRIKRFKEVSQVIVKKYGGKVPESRDEISKLPGVGDYIAGIVLLIAFNKKEWIVDSNVVRVFKRYFGISTSKEGRRDKHVIDIARTYADCKYPRKASLALLDFAALICTPRRPEHERCPLAKSCHYFIYDIKKGE
jgi:A/G-specific adenine glycosylase